MIWNIYLVQWRTRELRLKLIKIYYKSIAESRWEDLGIFEVDGTTIGLPLSKTKEWELIKQN